MMNFKIDTIIFVNSYLHSFVATFHKILSLYFPLRKPIPDMEKHESTHSLITEFSCDPDVQKVSINSTLNKKYIRDDDGCLTDDGKERGTYDGVEGRLVDDKASRLPENIMKRVLETGKIGKALIICNQHESIQGKSGEELKIVGFRQEALENAKIVLKEYFAFEVNF